MRSIPSSHRVWALPWVGSRQQAMATRALVAAMAMAGLGSLGGAHAATSPVKTTLGASSSVATSCVIQSTDSISFGAYQPTSGLGQQGSGVMTLRCTKGAQVAASPVSGGSKLQGGQGALTYALYTDSGLSKVWGAASAGVSRVLDFSNSNTLHFTNRSQGVTLAQCQSLSGGTLYAYNNNGLCDYNFDTTGKSVYLYSGGSVVADQYGSRLGLVVNGATVVAASANTGGYTYYATGTQTTGYQYNTIIAPGATQALSGTATGVNTPVKLTYYASVPGSQDVVPGAYVDTVVVQVTF